MSRAAPADSGLIVEFNYIGRSLVSREKIVPHVCIGTYPIKITESTQKL
jgi:hypothetical protein